MLQGVNTGESSVESRVIVWHDSCSYAFNSFILVILYASVVTASSDRPIILTYVSFMCITSKLFAMVFCVIWKNCFEEILSICLKANTFLCFDLLESAWIVFYIPV